MTTTNPRLILLHPAGVEPSDFAKLVGPLPFDCVYPRAANGSRWAHLGESADVAALMGIEADYIMGFSSGAFMCARMLEEKQYRGAMMVAGGFIKALRPRPTPLLLVHGTLDAQVPYAGTSTTLGPLDTADEMRALLKLPRRSTSTVLDADKDDGATATRFDWSGRVVLYRCDRAGHTYPTGPRRVWQPPSLGRVCRDFDASLKMCEFFTQLNQQE